MKNLSYKAAIFLIVQTLIFSLHSENINAQPPFEWQKTIGGTSSDILYSVQQTGDGGYILGGHSSSNISGNKTENSQGNSDYWVLKLDGSGAIQWQNTIGGSDSDYLRSIQQTSDGGYVLGGGSWSNISGDKTENKVGNEDYWVVKLDSLGAIQWQNTIGGTQYDYLYSIQQTADGGYILGGYSDSPISGDKTDSSQGGKDYWVVKLNTSGVIQWQNTIGGSANDLLRSIQQTNDGGYILGGFSQSNISGDKTENSQGIDDYWVVKLDSLGSIQWQNTIGGSAYDALYSIQQTSDNGYVLGGRSQSNISGDKTENSQGMDYWVVKLDTSGVIQWQNTIGGSSHDYLESIRQTGDGGYILGGYSQSDSSGDKTENAYSSNNFDYWIIKLDSVGGIQWQNTIGGDGYDALYSIQQTIDGGYVFGGQSSSDSTGDKTDSSWGGNDYWVIKLCGTYTSNISQNICSGDSLLLPGGIYTSISDTYYDTLVNISGCDSVIVTTLTVNSLPTDFITNTSVSCTGGADGTAVVTTSGGAPPYTYLWSTGSILDSISSLSAGPYSITIMDSNGCTVMDSTTISEPLTLSTSIVNTDETCIGTNDGTAIAAVSGGTLPYAYTWLDSIGNTIQTTLTSNSSDTVTGLTADLYTLAITDGNGCNVADTVVISVSGTTPLAGFTQLPSGNIGCVGDSIVLTNTSASATSYSWLLPPAVPSNDTDFSFTPSSPGVYTITLIASNGLCADTVETTITIYDNPTSSIMVSDVTCLGACNGSAENSVSGGNAPYTYLWSNGQTSSIAMALCDTTYTVLVTDSIGCMAQDTVVVAVSNNMSALITGVTPASCANICDGIVSAFATGGTTPYSYLWNNRSSPPSWT